MYLGESEGANFWIGILTDIQSRRLEDIFIACIYNLIGFAQTIESNYPKTELQLCVIHQVCNTLWVVPIKDNREVVIDKKSISSVQRKFPTSPKTVL